MTTATRPERGTERVWLVRHASTAWTGRRFCGRTDLPLSPLGRDEAAAMAARLAPTVPRDVLVVSGPAVRARETAERLRASLRGEGRVEVDHRLAEVDFGRAGLAAGAAVDWPAGESAQSVRVRARAVWLDVLRRSGPWMLVTHGGFIRALLEVICGPFAMPDVWIGPAAVVEIAPAGRRWKVVSVRAPLDGSQP